MGAPATGKTTIATQLAAEHNATIISIDDIRAASTTNPFQAADQAITKELLAGHNIIVDATHLGDSRTRTRRHAEHHAAHTELHIIKSKQAATRNTQRTTPVPHHIMERMTLEQRAVTPKVYKEPWARVHAHNTDDGTTTVYTNPYYLEQRNADSLYTNSSAGRGGRSRQGGRDSGVGSQIISPRVTETSRIW
jgi:predicted kinase